MRVKWKRVSVVACVLASVVVGVGFFFTISAKRVDAAMAPFLAAEIELLYRFDDAAGEGSALRADRIEYLSAWLRREAILAAAMEVTGGELIWGAEGTLSGMQLRRVAQAELRSRRTRISAHGAMPSMEALIQDARQAAEQEEVQDPDKARLYRRLLDSLDLEPEPLQPAELRSIIEEANHCCGEAEYEYVDSHLSEELLTGTYEQLVAARRKYSIRAYLCTYELPRSTLPGAMLVHPRAKA